VTEGEHAAVHAVEETALDGQVDLPLRQPGCTQLATGDDPVLGRRSCRDAPPGPVLIAFPTPDVG
jgi:hypothetical protein